MTQGLTGNIWADLLGILLSLGIGLGCGSFATMPYYRFPAGEPVGGKWTGRRSHCTACGHQLRTRDLLPVFNWLLTLGKCQFCGVRINPVYFFIEFSTAALSVLAFLRYGFDELQFYIVVQGLMTCLVILAATDYSFRVMPDPVLVAAVMFGFLYRPLLDGEIMDMILTFAGMVMLCLLWVKIREKLSGKPFAAYRHLKLAAIAGVWLHAPELIGFAVLALAGCGLLWGIARVKKTLEPPYGIALAAALATLALYQ